MACGENCGCAVQVPVQNPDTGLSLNSVKFISKIVDDINSDVEFAYPNRYFDEDKAHSALQNISGRIETLKAFIDNLK